MDLKPYIRSKLNNDWVVKVKQSECQICGEKDNLEVHHINQFIDILDYVIKTLRLEYKDTVEYTETELDNIYSFVLGKHYANKDYITCCTNCHDELHKQYGTNKSKLKDKVKEIKMNMHISMIKNYINSIKDITLYSQKDIITEIFNIRDERNRLQKSPSVINNFMEENNIPYELKTIRCVVDGIRKRCWIFIEKENI